MEYSFNTVLCSKVYTQPECVCVCVCVCFTTNVRVEDKVVCPQDPLKDRTLHLPPFRLRPVNDDYLQVKVSDQRRQGFNVGLLCMPNTVSMGVSPRTLRRLLFPPLFHPVTTPLIRTLSISRNSNPWLRQRLLSTQPCYLQQEGIDRSTLIYRNGKSGEGLRP